MVLCRYLDLLIRLSVFRAETRNIENAPIFQSDNKFIFHDSQRFEAGSEGESLHSTGKVLHPDGQARPSNPTSGVTTSSELLKTLLWYSLAYGLGIVLFTKYEALLLVALGKITLGDRQWPLEMQLLKTQPLVQLGNTCGNTRGCSGRGRSIWSHALL